MIINAARASVKHMDTQIDHRTCKHRGYKTSTWKHFFLSRSTVTSKLIYRTHSNYSFYFRFMHRVSVKTTVNSRVLLIQLTISTGQDDTISAGR